MAASQQIKQFLHVKDFYNWIKDQSGKNSPTSYYYFSVYFFQSGDTISTDSGSALNDSFFSSYQEELVRLRYCIQHITFPKINYAGYGANGQAGNSSSLNADSMFGTYTIFGNSYLGISQKTITIKILNTQSPVIQNFIYPWMIQCIRQNKTNQKETYPFPRLDMVVKFWKAGDMKSNMQGIKPEFIYFLRGIFPSSIQAYAPIQNASGQDNNRSVQFTFNQFIMAKDQATAKLFGLQHLFTGRNASQPGSWSTTVKNWIGNAASTALANSMKKNLKENTTITKTVLPETTSPTIQEIAQATNIANTQTQTAVNIQDAANVPETSNEQKTYYNKTIIEFQNKNQNATQQQIADLQQKILQNIQKMEGNTNVTLQNIQEAYQNGRSVVIKEIAKNEQVLSDNITQLNTVSNEQQLNITQLNGSQIIKSQSGLQALTDLGFIKQLLSLVQNKISSNRQFQFDSIAPITLTRDTNSELENILKNVKTQALIQNGQTVTIDMEKMSNQQMLNFISQIKSSNILNKSKQQVSSLVSSSKSKNQISQKDYEELFNQEANQIIQNSQQPSDWTLQQKLQELKNVKGSSFQILSLSGNYYLMQDNKATKLNQSQLNDITKFLNINESKTNEQENILEKIDNTELYNLIQKSEQPIQWNLSDKLQQIKDKPGSSFNIVQLSGNYYLESDDKINKLSEEQLNEFLDYIGKSQNVNYQELDVKTNVSSGANKVYILDGKIVGGQKNTSSYGDNDVQVVKLNNKNQLQTIQNVQENKIYKQLMNNKTISTTSYQYLSDYANKTDQNILDVIQKYKDYSGQDLQKFVLYLLNKKYSSGMNYQIQKIQTKENNEKTPQLSQSDIDDIF